MSDRLIASALAALVLVSRVPFASQTLWAWDSVLYARALEQGFNVGADLADQRPHPPGYIFYLAIAAAFRVVTHDSNAALVVVSVLASALTAAAVYLLCRRYADRALAIVITLGAMTAPLVWTYGEVAMPYALLGPLWLWMLATRSWRERALCAAGVGIAALAWFGPSASLSGGPAAYLASLGGQAARVGELSPAAGGDALLRNTLLTVYALWWGLLGFALLLVAAIIAALLARRRLSGEATFFVLWLIPAALVYVTIHIGDPGYLMSVLPGLYVACAALIAPLARQAPRVVLAVAALLVGLNVGAFVVADTPFSARAILRHDRSLDLRLAFIRGTFAPNSTVILAQSEYLTARYYLPEYRVLFYGAGPEVLSRAAQVVRITSPTTVVVFGELAAPLPAALRLTSADVRSGSLDGTTSLLAYDLEPR